MMAAILYCRLCGTGYGSTGDVPLHCPSCQRPTKWGTSPPHTQIDTDGWKPNENDRRMLRAFRIDPE